MLGCVLVLILGVLYMFRARLPRHIPGSVPLPHCHMVPFLGAFPRAMRNMERMPEHQLEMDRSFKWKCWADGMPLGPPVIHLGDPECVKYVLKDQFYNFVKGKEHTTKQQHTFSYTHTNVHTHTLSLSHTHAHYTKLSQKHTDNLI